MPVEHIVRSEEAKSNMRVLDEQWGAATEDEVEVGDHGVFPLPMGIEWEDRCEQTGL